MRFRVLRPVERESLCVAAGSMAFALLFAWPILGHLGQFGAFHDWEFNTELHWVPYYTVLHYHQFPLWNPYKCGGMPMLGNPQSRVLTPFFLIHLLAGPVLGLQLEVILHLAIAWSGGYVLGRTLGLSYLGCVVCASVFPSNSWFFLHIGEGHVVLMAITYMPWVGALFCIAVNRKTLFPAALAGLLIALTFWEGGLYVAVFCGVLIGSVGLTMAASRWSLWPLWSAATAVAFAGGFAAIKLLPALEVFRSYPRAAMGGETNPWSLIFVFLFSRNQDLLRNDLTSFGFFEYGAYISIAFAALAVIGSVSYWRRSLPWTLSALVLLLMARGDTGSHSIWMIIRNVPFFAGMLTAMRFPSRILGAFALPISVLAGCGTDVLLKYLRTWGMWLSTVTLAIGLIDSWLVGPPNLKLIFRDSTRQLPVSFQFRQMRELGAKFNMTYVAMANMGALECYEYTDITTNVVGFDEPGYRGEQYLVGLGSVQLKSWTPNAVTYEITALAPTVLIVNQNYDPGWRVAEGTGEVLSSNGVLGVAVPAGRQQIKLVYHSKSFDYGLGIGVLTLLAMGLAWLFDNRRSESPGSRTS